MKIIRSISVLGIFVVMGIFPSVALSASYPSYTYKNADANYHLSDSELSTSGNVITAIGGTGVNAISEVVVFSPNESTPQWIYEAPEDAVFFDQDVSADGSTIVVCGSKVWVLDAATEQLLWSFDGGSEVFDTCTLSSNGSKVFAGNRVSNVYKWNRNSSEYKKKWTLSEGGFVDQVVVTPDGRKLFASTGYSYGFIKNTNNDDWTWEKETKHQIYSVALNKNGNFASMVAFNRNTSANNDWYVVGLKTTSRKWRWKKLIESTHSPIIQLSNNAKRLIVTSNEVFYGYNGRSGEKQWQYERNGSHTSLGASANGKFFTATEGLDYAFMFDWQHPGKNQSPYQIDGDLLFPSSAAMSGDGSTAVYEHDDFTVQRLQPGVLADLQDTIPIYEAGDDVHMQYFMSNPGKTNVDLQLRTSVSLPQFTFMTDLGKSVDDDETSANRGKLYSYVQETLPGYRETDDRGVQITKHDSTMLDFSWEMPDAALPSWLSGLVDALEIFDDIFGGLIDEISEPLGELVSNSTEWVSGLQEMSGQITYPMIGLGLVELYDPETNVVYSSDTFIFLYVL